MFTKISFGLDSFFYPKIKSFIEFTQKFISYDPSKIAPHICFLGVLVDTIFSYFFWNKTTLQLVVGIILDSYIMWGFLKKLYVPTNEIGFLSARVWHLTEMQIVFYLGFVFSVILHHSIKSFSDDVLSGLVFIFSIFFLSYVALCVMEFPPSKKKESFSTNLGLQF